MFLLYNAIVRWIFLLHWLTLLFLDELVRQAHGWPLHLSVHVPTPSQSSIFAGVDDSSSTVGAVPTILWPFFANDSGNGATEITQTTVTAAVLTQTSPDLDLWNSTENDQGIGNGDSFVEDHAGVWVIGVMSGTCILTIAFIVRALFSRAEAFRDPQENMFAQDGMDDHMGLGLGGTNGGPSGSDFAHL
ncbi:hypothetical protein FGIG_10195 [Fasciola gigantica]|uniref:Uncharacterized protein n=1 Tax=Fasciola gigantica TaxID=46835 RepID=A0A504YGZ5_FASGI|nr:hypothetical protein FGIG_10195 [Fasciola gigantica]